MKTILKLVMKNITIKPLRTAIIVLCLGAVSLAFSLYFTISTSSEELIENQVRTITGKTDIIISFQQGFDEKIELSDNADTLYVMYANVDLQLHTIENYKYVRKKQALIWGVDTEKAYDFEMLPEYETIDGNEVIITEEVAETFGYEMGDIICIPCADGTDTTLKVKSVFPCEKFLQLSPMTMIVTNEKASEISCIVDSPGTVIYVDVFDDSVITPMYEKLYNKYPDYIVSQIMGTAEVKEMILGLAGTFFLVFAVIFMMIVFIISAFSKNIASERLSVVGTIRSVGATKTGASMILYSECAIYGLLGGVLGSILFYCIKDFVLGNFFTTSLSDTVSCSVPGYISPIAICLSVALSCICSFVSILRTSKKSIKDIIFATKDTAYRPSVIMAVLGGVMFVTSIIFNVFFEEFIIKLLALIFYMCGICLIVPFSITVVSKIVIRFSKGRKFPVVRLSLIQLGTKKTLISQTIICTAVMTLTTAVYILTGSVDRLYSYAIYDCEAIIDELSEKPERYRNIVESEIIENYEFIYSREEMVNINDKKVSTIVFGYDGFNMLSGFSDVPNAIAKNEIVMDRAVMNRLGICEGDMVNITFKGDTVRPVTKEFIVKAACDSVYYDMRCIAVLLNLDTYKEIYHDYPSKLLIEAKDAAKVAELEKLLVDKQAIFKTADEYYETTRMEKSSITSILGAMLILGFALAIISAVGNHSVGYEQRKHEFAVLFSAGMSKNQLIKMLFIESVLSVTLSIVISVASMTVILNILSALLQKLDLEIPIYWDMKGIIFFIVIIAGSVILTVLSSIYTFRKMNIAEQLKQE